jgi:periplasmic protein CpxP/Spy
MNSPAKNKLLVWLVAILVIANAATLAIFWLGKKQEPAPSKGTPKEFLIQQLQLNTQQQAELDVLVKEHRQAAEQLRRKTRAAKESFFDLLKQTNITDSIKKAAAKAVSVNTEELDLLTLNHFQSVRSLCTPEQQKKFDGIIHEVTSMMARPRPPGGPGKGQRDPAAGQ